MDDNIDKVRFVKEKMLDDIWCDSIDYTLNLTRPIYEMFRFCDTDKLCLHLIYDIWDSMIEKVKEKKKIDMKERNQMNLHLSMM